MTSEKIPDKNGTVHNPAVGAAGERLLCSKHNKIITNYSCDCNIFGLVKDSIRMPEAVSFYGLKIRKNGMARCPFHDDHHPSFKIYERNYHCFGCGRHGDVINFTADYFGLSQVEAARKLIEDFRIPVQETRRENEKKDLYKETVRLLERMDDEEILSIRQKYDQWKRRMTDRLMKSRDLISLVKNKIRTEETFSNVFSDDFAVILQAEPYIDYWLDGLCAGSEEDAASLLYDRREVNRCLEKVNIAGKRIMGNDRTGAVCRG